jgi:AcrR family transcriptional regulator
MSRAKLDPETVVETAAEIADLDGLDAVTLRSVADTLDVKPPSLYTHVDGLLDLRRRLARLAAGELADALTPAAAGRAGGEALRAVGRAYRQWTLAHPGRHAAMQFVLVPDNPAAERVAALMLSVMNGYGLEGDPAIHGVRAMRSAIDGFVTLETSGGFGIPPDTDESFEWLLDMLDRGMS